MQEAKKNRISKDQEKLCMNAVLEAKEYIESKYNIELLFKKKLYNYEITEKLLRLQVDRITMKQTSLLFLLMVDTCILKISITKTECYS